MTDSHAGQLQEQFFIEKRNFPEMKSGVRMEDGIF